MFDHYALGFMWAIVLMFVSLEAIVRVVEHLARGVFLKVPFMVVMKDVLSSVSMAHYVLYRRVMLAIGFRRRSWAEGTEKSALLLRYVFSRYRKEMEPQDVMRSMQALTCMSRKDIIESIKAKSPIYDTVAVVRMTALVRSWHKEASGQLRASKT